ncbi:MAG: nucleotidyltransferase domain-containing protein [Chloroflexi bacterium]|nr:MAG: nucleotidyltransferase domain-containing protein [Chloroflexota bacterium]
MIKRATVKIPMTDKTDKAIQSLVTHFSRKLGDQLEAVYLFGSHARGYHQPGESDVNLLLVVADGTNIHLLRDLFRPIWQAYGEILRRAPYIAEVTAFRRWLHLNNLLAHHLKNDGRQLLGAPDYLDDLPPLDPHEGFGRLAAEVMVASAALAPDLLAPNVAQERLRLLRRLARRIRGKRLVGDETAVQLFARIQHFLAPQIGRLPAIQAWRKTPLPQHTSPILPGLQAIYKETGNMVLVFNQLTPQQILNTNWQLLAQRLQNQANGLAITTTDQLCLALSYESPLDICLQRYEHNWGTDILSNLHIPTYQLLRHAARIPTDIQIDSLPNAYFTQGEDKLHTIIHDFQNRLLNIQLEHELLCRIHHLDHFTPPEPLPDRKAPPLKRIDAIFQHLHWWAEHYAGDMAELQQET